MKDRKQINKIAKSLFNAALSAETVKTTGKSLRVMAKLLEDNPEIVRFFNDIFQDVKNHKAVLGTITKEGDFDELTQGYLHYLLEMRLMDTLPIIAGHYQRLADSHLGQERALVSSPVALDKTERGRLGTALGTIMGKKIIINEHIDKSLIAGVSVRIGSMIFDGSLSNQLQRIEKEMSNAS